MAATPDGRRTSQRKKLAAVGLKEQADNLFKQNHLDEALQLYEEALQQWTAEDGQNNKKKLYANRCLAYLRNDQYQPALLDARSVLLLDPLWPKGWFRLGSVCLCLGFAAEAVTCFKTGLQLEPSSSELKAQLAKALAIEKLKANSTAGAEQQHPQTQQHETKLFIYSILQNSSLLCGLPWAASASSAEPSAAMLAGASTQVQAAPLAPRTTNAACSDEDAAQEDFVHAVSVGGAVSATGAEANGHATEPLSAQGVRTVAQDAAQSAEAYRQEGNAQYKAGNYEAALATYSRAIEAAPESAQLYGNRSAAALMLQQYKVVLADCMKASQLDPTFVRAYSRGAKACLCMGRFSEAASLLQEACRLDASNAAYQEEAAAVQLLQTQLDKAQACLQDGDARMALWHADCACRATSPSSEPALMLRVRALLALHRAQEAVVASRSLTIEGDSSAPEVLSIRGSALYLSGNMTMAQRMFEASLQRDPDCTPSARGLKRIRALNNSKEAGNAAFESGRWQEAYDNYTSALNVDPDLKTTFTAQCVCNRAAASSKLGRHHDAAADAEQAIDIEPGFVKAYLRRGTAFMALEKFEEAIRDFEKVRELDSSTSGLSDLLRQAKVALKKQKRVDYYKLLDVDSSASDAEIKRAYKKAALKLHPDKVSVGERDEATVKFKLLGQANSVLTDPDKRRKYDAGWTMEEIEQGGPGMSEGGGVSMDEVVARMFGGGAFGGSGMGGMPGGMPRGFPGTRSRYSHY